MNRGQSFIIFQDLAFVLQQKYDDVLVSVFSCEVESRVPVVIACVCVDLVVKQDLRHFDLPSKTGDVEPGPVKLCHSVHVCLVLAEQLDDVVVPLVAGIVERGPVI